jgi:hypothetical protein
MISAIEANEKYKSYIKSVEEENNQKFEIMQKKIIEQLEYDIMNKVNSGEMIFELKDYFKNTIMYGKLERFFMSYLAELGYKVKFSGSHCGNNLFLVSWK